jgi:hypothetical protein
MQDKLKSAAPAMLLKFQFGHGEMMFQQVFLTAQCDMNKMSKMFKRPHLSRRFRKPRCLNWMTHAGQTLARVIGDFSDFAAQGVPEVPATFAITAARGKDIGRSPVASPQINGGTAHVA